MLKNQLSIPLLWTLVLENVDQLCEVCGLPGMCFFFFFFFFLSQFGACTVPFSESSVHRSSAVHLHRT